MIGGVVWITGLSGAGKTTLAQAVAQRLRRGGHPVLLLDGDELREVFSLDPHPHGHHRRDDRLALAMRYAKLSRMVAAQGIKVVVATISMFREVHRWNRENIADYFEVYLQVPLDELRRRDPKGIYRRFEAGELHNVAGLDVPVDEPLEADWIVSFPAEHDTATLADRLFDRLIFET